MNSFIVIDILQTHTEAGVHGLTFSRIYDTSEKLRPFLPRMKSFPLT